jgi:class 3 adenylate cyclase
VAANDSKPSLEGWLARAEHGVCLVFADIVGSALLVHAKGTKVYAHMLSAYRTRAEGLVGALDGRIISKEGDEIFAAFLTATGGYRFAREMSDDAGDPLISVRVGVHFGTVSCHDSGLVGRVVPMAQRVMDHAGPHELWISDAAKQALDAEQPSLVGEIQWLASEVCQLAGIPESQLLWRAL